MTLDLVETPFRQLYLQKFSHLNYDIGTANTQCCQLRYPWNEISQTILVMTPEFLPIIKSGVCFPLIYNLSRILVECLPEIIFFQSDLPAQGKADMYAMTAEQTGLTFNIYIGNSLNLKFVPQ